MRYRLATVAFFASSAVAASPALAQNQPASDRSDSTTPVVASPASAQTQPASEQGNSTTTDQSGETIVVTGGRGRAEQAQQAPIAVAVVNQEQIEALHGRNISDLASVAPNLTVTQMGATQGSASISIRGFSAAQADAAAEPGVAVYIDGVYQVVNKGSLTDLFDVERIEVLNGPQSAILGRSASAGALLITHRRPTNDFEGRVQAEYGSHNLIQLNGMVNVPIVQDTLAGSVSAGYRRRDGYFTNLSIPGGTLGGEERGSARAALLFTPSDVLEVYLTGDYRWDRSQQAGARNVSGPTFAVCGTFGFCNPTGAGYQVANYNFVDHAKSDEHNIAGHVRINPGSVVLTSITGYKRATLYNPVDLDTTSVTVNHFWQNYDITAFSEELRITPQAGDGLDLGGRLSWVLGAYYGHSRAYSDMSQLSSPIQTIPRRQSQATIRDGYALFGQADFDPFENLTLSFGARQSHDSVDHYYDFAVVSNTFPTRNLSQSISFNNTSFEGGIRYKFSPTRMVYLRYAEGYRSGGFNGIPGNVAATTPFGAETTAGYEAGLKTTWLDGRLLFDVTLFDVEFTGLQRIITVLLPGGSVASITTNAASARTRGFEIQSVIRPAPNLTFRANFGYLDAKYLVYSTYNAATGTSTDLSGQPLTFAPKFTLMASADYTVDLGTGFLGFHALNAHAAVNLRDDFEMSNQLLPVGHQDGYATTDASLRLESSLGRGFSLEVYAHNIFDVKYQDWASAVAGLVAARFDNVGRTFGVVLDARF